MVGANHKKTHPGQEKKDTTAPREVFVRGFVEKTNGGFWGFPWVFGPPHANNKKKEGENKGKHYTEIGA